MTNETTETNASTPSLFERASRAGLLFYTVRGPVGTDQLWKLKLTSNDGLNLNDVAKNVSAELKSAGEEDFVSTTENPAKAELTLKLDVLKHIIAFKLAEADKAKKRAERIAERKRLLTILEDKKDESLKGMSIEQIMARIGEVEAEL